MQLESANLKEASEASKQFSIPLVITMKGSVRHLLEPPYMRCIVVRDDSLLGGAGEPCEVADCAGRGDGSLNKCL